MGPLRDVTILEFSAIGPVPFAGMLLSDLGARVVRIDRPNEDRGPLGLEPHRDPLLRGRRSVAVDLKHPRAAETVLKLVEKADALIEGFRPGVMERLGLGPETCSAVNQRLVYGRMTGWGQTGPLAKTAGHDIDYIAVAGALGAIGHAGTLAAIPLNLVADFPGGLLLACGVLSGVIESARSGLGQVVDAAMVDGVAMFLTMFHGLAAAGLWNGRRGDNLLDGGAPFYSTYETADGLEVAVGALEPKFFAELLDRLGLDPSLRTAQTERSRWPELRALIADRFRSRSRREWCEVFAGSDACFAPVLSLEGAPAHPHLRDRQTFVEFEGVVQAAPAPRFERTPGNIQGPPRRSGSDTSTLLSELGCSDATIEELFQAGVVFGD